MATQNGQSRKFTRRSTTTLGRPPALVYVRPAQKANCRRRKGSARAKAPTKIAASAALYRTDVSGAMAYRKEFPAMQFGYLRRRHPHMTAKTAANLSDRAEAEKGTWILKNGRKTRAHSSLAVEPIETICHRARRSRPPRVGPFQAGIIRLNLSKDRAGVDAKPLPVAWYLIVKKRAQFWRRNLASAVSVGGVDRRFIFVAEAIATARLACRGASRLCPDAGSRAGWRH